MSHHLTVPRGSWHPSGEPNSASSETKVDSAIKTTNKLQGTMTTIPEAELQDLLRAVTSYVPAYVTISWAGHAQWPIINTIAKIIPKPSEF